MDSDVIPVFRPWIDEAEISASRRALENGWLGMGSFVDQFEREIAGIIGSPDRHVAAVSTGHGALHLALMLIGAGPGDEIITPSFNNITDFQAILATGASPVFCDIDEDSLCIDLEKAEALITPQTKEMIVTDYGCGFCDHDAVSRLAKKYGLRVIHDGAHSFGSKYHGRRVGSFSDITMFSFDPVKTITSIDGGALVVRTREELERVREMRLVGMSQSSATLYQDQRAWSYDVRMLGFRYHMANLHAAIGLAQLEKIEAIAESRRAACSYLNERLGEVPDLICPRTSFDDLVPFLYYVRVPAQRRNSFRAYLKERGIDTGIHWQPGHWFTLLKPFDRGGLEVTERVGHEIVSLPLHSKMPQPALDRIVQATRCFFQE
jgi:dTDP-4-amino-4,6-dideoxygalactose transaminase